MDFGKRNLNYWVLGPSGEVSSPFPAKQGRQAEEDRLPWKALGDLEGVDRPLRGAGRRQGPGAPSPKASAQKSCKSQRLHVALG